MLLLGMDRISAVRDVVRRAVVAKFVGAGVTSQTSVRAWVAPHETTMKLALRRSVAALTLARSTPSGHGAINSESDAVLMPA